jgi:hypothetical protein
MTRPFAALKARTDVPAIAGTLLFGLLLWVAYLSTNVTLAMLMACSC